MARKTVQLTEVVKTANCMLADSVDDQVHGRLAVAMMTESLLMDAGAYRGFAYLPSEFANGGPADEHAPLLRAGYDDSRRRYYVTNTH